MKSFTYTQANDAAAAVTQKTTEPKAKFLAGGTNLLDLMKAYVEEPNALIDLKHAPLQQIENNPEGGLRLGALATNADTAYHPEVQKRYPLLAKTILAGASPQLRNMATNGGNLLQRTRCYYFYDNATACNKREPGTGCAALNGYNRIHAILGASQHCIATHPSDMCVALAALEAIINVTGPNGERQIPIAEFHRLPENRPELDSTLAGDELITSIDLPAKTFPKNFAYLKIRDRHSYAFALVSVAVVLELEGNIIKEARLAMGGVAHKPWRKPEAEEALKGKTATPENFAAAADILLTGAQSYGHNNFKIALAKRAVIRGLTQAVEMQKEPDSLFNRTTSEPN